MTIIILFLFYTTLTFIIFGSKLLLLLFFKASMMLNSTHTLINITPFLLNMYITKQNEIQCCICA